MMPTECHGRAFTKRVSAISASDTMKIVAPATATTEPLATAATAIEVITTTYTDTGTTSSECPERRMAPTNRFASLSTTGIATIAAMIQRVAEVSPIAKLIVNITYATANDAKPGTNRFFGSIKNTSPRMQNANAATRQPQEAS